jgi:peptide/nickel transport system substrate-binding protein
MLSKRNLWTLLSALVLVIMVAAQCGQPATPAVAPATDTPAPAPTNTPEQAAAEAPTQAAMAELGTIRVGTNAEYPPFESVDASNNVIGFDPDLMKAIAQEAGFEVEYVNTRWDGIFVALASGEFDAVISAATITDERKQTVDFSDPYFNAGQMIAVKIGSDIKVPADLDGKRVGVQLGTTGDIWTSDNTSAEVVRYDEITLAFQALAQGDVDAVVNDGPTSADIVKANPEMGVTMVGEPFTDELYGIAVNKDRPEVLAAINQGLEAVRASGEYDQIYNKWFGAPAAEAPAAAETAMGGGGTFIFGRGGDSVQLDPAIVTDGESFRVTGQCLEPLYQYEPGSTTPIPALATKCTANAESTEWTCELRQGVKFHDGTDFNADAVIFNFERWRFTDNPYHFESQVFEYYEYMWFGFDNDSVITQVEKVDDYTVKFVLNAPLAPFLANLAMDMFAISSPAAIEKYGEDYGTPQAGCVGTGPFKFVEWVEGDHITVAANDDYWGGRPTIDEIVWRVIPDDSARFLALKSGDIDALEQASAEDVAAADADPDLYVLARPALNTGYLAFNYRIQEFQDKRVREAVAHAINRQALVENFYGPYGEVATNFLPPLVWGHNDQIEDWAYDPDMSQQLLADAGFPDGLSEVTIAEDIQDAEGNVVYAAGDKIPLKLYYMPVTRFYYPSPKEIGEAMAADLAKAGINAQLELAGDWPTYLGLRRDGQLVGLYMLGWGGDNGDPDNFLNYFFGGLSSADEVKEPDEREGFYANQEVASLLYQAATNPNQDERRPIYEQVEQLLHDDVARLWVVHNNTPLLFSTKVSGYVPQPVGADYYEFTVVEQ